VNDRIEIVRQIGAGAHFDAFEARDVLLCRPVFLKRSRAPAEQPAAAIIDAHVDLWRSVAAANVQGIPKIFDLYEESGHWMLVTEWIGFPLAQSNLREIGDVNQFLLNLLNRTLVILRDMHKEGLVHADISPRNILAEHSETPQVFLIDPAPQLNIPDPDNPDRKLILTNPGFAAPEVLAGQPSTVQSDLFSLGKVIAETANLFRVRPPDLVQDLTARQPWRRPSSAAEAIELLRQQLNPTSLRATFSAGSVNNLQDGGTRLVSVHRDEWQSPTVTKIVPVNPPVEADDYGRGAGEDATIMAPVPRMPPDPWLVTAIKSVPVPKPDKAAPPTPADFAVIAPPLIQAGRNFIVEVWVAPTGERETMLAEATRGGRMVERAGRSHIDLNRDTLITVLLKLPDFEVPDPAETLGWNGDIRNVGFIVKAPASLAPGVYPGLAKLMQGQAQAPFASIMFDLEVASAERGIDIPAKVVSTHVQRITRAFASYASQDRSEVLRRVQGIQAAGTSVFLDIVNLRSGDFWEPTLYREIDASDGFFLFWSRAASKSPWVEKEWRYALERRGIEFINPLALEDPRNAEPPAELKAKHFNDMLLAFIKAEEANRNSSGQVTP
jgi:serine/threonine protein kinase